MPELSPGCATGDLIIFDEIANPTEYLCYLNTRGPLQMDLFVMMCICIPCRIKFRCEIVMEFWLGDKHFLGRKIFLDKALPDEYFHPTNIIK